MKRTQEERDQFVALRANEMLREPTPAERAMRDLLKPLGFRFQVPMKGKTKNGGVYDYILDCYHDASRLSIEIDGRQHAKRTKGRDRRRSSRLAFAADIRTLRYTNKRVLNPKEAEAIVAEVTEAMNGQS